MIVKVKVIKREFTVCKVDSLEQIDFSDKYCFVGKTDEEISLICSTRHAPRETVSRSDGWRGFRLQGQLDLNLIGVISELTGILARNKISVLAVGTYNTDYLLVRGEDLEKTLILLEDQDYKIIQ